MIMEHTHAKNTESTQVLNLTTKKKNCVVDPAQERKIGENFTLLR